MLQLTCPAILSLSVQIVNEQLKIALVLHLISRTVSFIKELLLFEKNIEPIENKGGEMFFSNNET